MEELHWSDKHEKARVAARAFSFWDESVLVAGCSVGDGVEDIVCGLDLAAKAVAQRIVEDEGLLAALVAVGTE